MTRLARSLVATSAALGLTAACTAPTPTGAALIAVDSSRDIPAAVATTLETPEARSHTVPLSDGVRVKVQLGVAKARDGGRYLTQLAASVEEPAGWVLSAAVAGTPTNRGAGTGASVIMAQALAITQRRATLRGTKLRTTVIEALADGTVTTR